MGQEQSKEVEALHAMIERCVGNIKNPDELVIGVDQYKLLKGASVYRTESGRLLKITVNQEHPGLIRVNSSTPVSREGKVYG